MPPPFPVTAVATSYASLLCLHHVAGLGVRVLRPSFTEAIDQRFTVAFPDLFAWSALNVSSVWRACCVLVGTVRARVIGGPPDATCNGVGVLYVCAWASPCGSRLRRGLSCTGT